MGANKKSGDKPGKKDKKRELSGSSGLTPDEKLARRLNSQDFDENELTADQSSCVADIDRDAISKPGSIEEALDRVKRHLSSQIDGVDNSVEFLSKIIEDLREELQVTKAELKHTKDLENDINTLKLQNKQMHQKLLDLENYSRRENLIISGILENETEKDSKTVCSEFFKDKLKINKPIEIIRCHRIGKPGGKRPLIVRFREYEDKELVLKQRKLLKNSAIYLNDDLCAGSRR